MVNEGYTEYGYRGLEELKQAQDKIAKLEAEIQELKERLENENKSDNQ